MKKKPHNYISGPKMHKTIVEWYASGKDEIPNTLAIAVMQICNNLAKRYNFKNYTWKDEFISAGILDCTNALRGKKYNAEKFDNPFSFFSMVAYNAFRRVINKEKEQVSNKHKALQQHILECELNGEHIIVEDDHTGRLENLLNKYG